MIFLRHPVTEAVPGLCYGRMDLGLGAGADAQIAAALENCPRAVSIVSSPAVRCRALADPLASRDGVVASYDPRIWELDFGSWEGRMWDDIPRAESDPWAADYWNIAPPGGESFARLCTRVGDVLAEVPTDSVVIAHAGVIRAARILLEGASLDEIWGMKIPYAAPLVIGRRAA